MTSSPPASAGRPQRRLRRSARRQARAEARFVGGGEFTVGAEEELLLVGPDDQLQPGSAEPLLAAIDQQPGGTATHELFDSEIEFASAVGHNGEEVSDSLRTLREALGAAGGRPLAAGVHPAGAFADVGLTRSARYDPIGADLAGLLRTPTAALQVHVGMPDANAAMAAMGGLRHQLAMLRALTASSPYWHGRDSGLASARWAVLKSYPRSGVPPAVRNWEEYVTLTRALVAAAEVPDYTHVWWDLRAHPRFGTIEVRVMDTQPSLAVVAGLVTLIQGLARSAVEGPPPSRIPSEVLAENDFRVARHGLEARIVGVDGTLGSVRQAAAHAIATARAALDHDGSAEPLSALEQLLRDEPPYERQRRIHAQLGMAGLLRDLVVRTRRGA